MWGVIVVVSFFVLVVGSVMRVLKLLMSLSGMFDGCVWGLIVMF